MQRYLLDTNTLSDLVRNPQGAVFEHIKRVGSMAICTSIIVSAELYFGVEKSGSIRLKNQIDRLLSICPVFPLDAPVVLHYASIRQYLTRTGKLIGPNDLLIAAHARSLDCIMVTANLFEFTRVPDLSVENWVA